MERRRTILWIAAALAPVILVGAVAALADAARQRERTFGAAATFARSAAHLLEAELGGSFQELEEVASRPELARALAHGLPADVGGFLEPLVADPAIVAVAVVGPEGEVVAARAVLDPALLEAGWSLGRARIVPGGRNEPPRAVLAVPIPGTSPPARLFAVRELETVQRVLAEAHDRIAPTLVVGEAGRVLLGPPGFVGAQVDVAQGDPPSVVVRLGDLRRTGAAEPLRIAGGEGQVIALVEPALLGSPISWPGALALLAAVAVLTAIGLAWSTRLARAERRVHGRERELEALQDVALEAASSPDRLRPLRVAGRRAAELVGADQAWTVMDDGHEGALSLYRAHPTPDLESAAVPVAGNPRVARVLRAGRREEGPAEGTWPAEGGWEVWTPLVSHGRVLGALGLRCPGPDRSCLDHETLLDGIAATLASALENHDVLGELRRQRAMLARVLEASPDGIFALDAQNQVVLDNPAMRAFVRSERPLLGLSPTEVLGVFERRGGRIELDYDVPETIAAARAGVTVRGTLRLFQGDSVVHGESLMSALRLPGGERGVLVAIRDVTARAELDEVRELHRHVEEIAALASERAALLESVLASSDVGFVFLDRDDEVGYVTELAARLLGLEVLPRGTPERILEDMIAARTEEDVAGILERGGRLRLDDGRRRFLAVTVSEVRSGGQPVGRLISIRDETAQRQLEIAREEFLGIAAHELKNPLAAVRLQSDLGLRGDSARRTEALEKIRRKATELTELVERLLDVTRADLGRLVTERAPVDVAAAARDVAEGFAPSARLEVRADEETLAVGDPTRIRQVITNLVSNAVRYAGQDGPIEVAVLRRPDAVHVQVRDRGPGIPPEEQARIFERFGQGKEARRGPGLGIGLYLARRIAEEHGGRLLLDSAPGKGSTFTLVLPVAPELHPPVSAA